MGRNQIDGLRFAAPVLLVLAALLFLSLLLHVLRVRRERMDAGEKAGEGIVLPEPYRWTSPPASLWGVFRSGIPSGVPTASGSLSQRYRLAGVFLSLSDAVLTDGQARRSAILDDLQNQKQYLVGEEERVGDVRVVKVENDHVVLSDGSREEMIYIAAGTLPAPSEEKSVTLTDVPVVLETNRFGNRVSETRWEFSREAILEYYQEMMDHPERLVGLFSAMEPARSNEGHIEGYRLNTEAGEKEFYAQVGLQQGDVIRRVNSMHMTSQRRAEYFIGEFVKGDLGAIVLDIERDGQPEKLVYLIK